VEKASENWHRRVGRGEILDFDITEYPSWNFIAADRQTELNGIFPAESPYRIIPLTSPQQLADESHEMHHCVVYYIDSCIGGETRIFSVLHVSNNKPVATAELSKHNGKWNLVQLKGKCNEELIHRMNVSSDPLATALGILINWYNQNSRPYLRLLRHPPNLLLILVWRVIAWSEIFFGLIVSCKFPLSIFSI